MKKVSTVKKILPHHYYRKCSANIVENIQATLLVSRVNAGVEG